MAETDKTATHAIKKHDGATPLPPVSAPRWLQGFVDFMREQGVVGVAIGLVLGVASKSVVDSLVNNIFNPIVGALAGGSDLSSKYICLRHAADGTCASKLGYGNVINELISFVIVAAAVYFIVKGLKLEKLDKKKPTA